MEDFLDRIFNSDFVVALRDLFSQIGEKIENIEILHRTPSKKFLLTGFAVLIAVLVAFSTVIVISDKSKDEEQTTDAVTTEAAAAVSSVQTVNEIDATFLLALTDNDKTAVHSIIIAKFSSEEEKLDLSFVNPNEVVTVNDSTGNMQQHLQTGGISQFLWAISEFSGQGFNRYLISDEAAFVNLMSMLGDTTIEIPNQISYDHNGISFIIDKGTQNLTADMMLKYYLYLTYNPEANAEQIGFVLSDMVSRLLTADNDELLQERFCKALGFFSTDISAIDFSNYKEAIKAIPSMPLYKNEITE